MNIYTEERRSFIDELAYCIVLKFMLQKLSTFFSSKGNILEANVMDDLNWTLMEKKCHDLVLGLKQVECFSNSSKLWFVV